MQVRSDNTDLNRVRILSHDKCEGVLSAEGAEELSKLLVTSEQARSEYWEIVLLHLCLDSGPDALPDLDLSARSRHADEGHPTGTPSMGRFGKLQSRSLAGLFLALAGCLLVGVAFSWRFGGLRDVGFDQAHDTKVVGTPEVAGVLKPLGADSRWTFGRRGKANSDVFCQGDTISVLHGAVEFRMPCGTVAILCARSVMQVISLEQVRLLSGVVKVTVAEGAEGFSVETASAEVIDLGTEFSVEVNDCGTNLVVYDGQVDLLAGERVATAKQQSAAPRRFRGGQAVHVSNDGTLSRIVNVQQSAFGTASSTPKPQVIRAVRDDIRRAEMFSFYEIVPHGIKEDAKAFVDRTHEWNGVTNDGLPHYLLNADYVKTFCDDKITSGLTIELELDGPAVVYVFMDNRLTAPDWLIERFEDTGDEIGLDESYLERGHAPEVGPGNGIENSFSIWRMVAEQGGVVNLGHNGDTTEEEIARGVKEARLVMYGIAAAPLGPTL